MDTATPQKQSITLDGLRARIGSNEHRNQCKFALIWQIDNPCHQAEFSWGAVDRILAKGGKFKS